MVQSKAINLASLLRFEPETGHIWLKDYRMVMLVLSRNSIEADSW